jgi:hypothetical protein
MQAVLLLLLGTGIGLYNLNAAVCSKVGTSMPIIFGAVVVLQASGASAAARRNAGDQA